MAQMNGLNKTVRVAQKAENWTSVTRVMGSSPTLGQAFFLSCLLYYMDVLIHFPIFYLQCCKKHIK